MTAKIDTHINEIQQEINALNSQVEELQSRIAELQKMQSKLKDEKVFQKFEDKTSKILAEAKSLNVEIPSKEEFEKVYDKPYHEGGLTDQERKIFWKLPYHSEEVIAEDQSITKARLSGIKSTLYKKFSLAGTPRQKTIALKAISAMYL